MNQEQNNLNNSVNNIINNENNTMVNNPVIDNNSVVNQPVMNNDINLNPNPNPISNPGTSNVPKKNKTGLIILICALVIVIIVVLVLVIGFGKKDNSKNNQDRNIEETKEEKETSILDNLKYEKDYSFWGYNEDVVSPKMKEMEYNEINVSGNTLYKTTTPLNLDVESALTKLKNNSYLKEYYEDFRISKSEIHTGINKTGNNYYVRYGFYNYILAKKKGQTATSFNVYTHYYPELYNNPSIISLKMENVDAATFDQKEFYEVAKIIFGEYADYLVLGKDSDGLTPKGGSLTNEISMIDIVEAGDGAYKFVRTINYNEDYNTLSISMFVEVNKNPKLLKEDCFSDKSDLYKANAYTPSNVFSKSFGSTNPLDSTNFGVSYFKSVLPEFKKSYIDYWTVSTSTHEDGTVDYSFSIATRNIGDYVNKGTINYSIHVSEKDGVITKLNMNTATYWKGKNINLYSQKYLDDCVKLAKMVLPGLEIPKMTYKNGVTLYKENITYKINGQEMTGTFTVNQGSYAYIIFLSM